MTLHGNITESWELWAIMLTLFIRNQWSWMLWYHTWSQTLMWSIPHGLPTDCLRNAYGLPTECPRTRIAQPELKNGVIVDWRPPMGRGCFLGGLWCTPRLLNQFVHFVGSFPNEWWEIPMNAPDIWMHWMHWIYRMCGTFISTEFGKHKRP